MRKRGRGRKEKRKGRDAYQWADQDSLGRGGCSPDLN